MATTLVTQSLNLLLRPLSRCKSRSQPLINQSSRFVSYQKLTDAVVFEVTSGAGGVEAMLFADEMLAIYLKYFSHMRWPSRVLEESAVSLGGVRNTKLQVEGSGCLMGLVQEAGVHRVQRVPKTEKSGRMHTSTISVSVTPKSVLDIKVKDSDLEWQAKRSSGAGGQHVNKTESAIRLLHKPTGIVIDAQQSRFQIDNRKIALRKLHEQLRDRELQLISSQNTILRRSQIGNMDRNEKIRTYNFPQDRITDHRINKSYHNLQALFNGDIRILEKMAKDFEDYKNKDS